MTMKANKTAMMLLKEEIVKDYISSKQLAAYKQLQFKEADRVHKSL